MDFLKNFSKNFSNMKTRSLVVVLGVVLVVVVILVWTAFRTDPSQVLQEGTQTKRIRPIESLPGIGTPSITYDPLQEQENIQQAEQALKTGQSQVARLLNQPPEGYGRGGFGFDDGTARCEDECYDEDGYDLDGLDRDGYDREGYDRNGYDKNGYDRDGYDRQGYDQEGYDKDGYDRMGYDRDGFDRNGCNRQGYDREGNLCAETLFGPDCFNSLGFDYHGCDRDGLDPDGNPCYNSEGYNAEGYDKCGLDRDGYDKNGRDRNGCDKDGLDEKGNLCYDEYGIGADGYDKDGYDKDGFNREGYDSDGYDRNGCNKEGLNRAGEACYDMQGYSEDGYDRQGYDRDGYGREGYDRNGYDKDGYDRDGYDKQGHDKDGYDRDGYDRNGCDRQGLDRQGRPCVGGVQDDFGSLIQQTRPIDTSRAAASEYERLLAEQQRLDAERLAELNAQQRAAALADQQARMEAFEALMSTQAQAILQAWAPPTQTYVVGQELEEPATTPGAGGGADGDDEAQGALIHKAGDILFAVMETAVNSDQPGPVLAKIVSGPLSGSKVLGSFQRQEKMLFIQFSLLSVPDVPFTVGIDAVAIDPETARTAVRTGLNNRYLLRYGTLIASSFLEGMGDAVLTSLGTPNLTDDSGTIIASQVTATGRDQLIAGLGKVGQRIGEDIDKSDTPPLVTLDSGTGVGLLLLQDLRIEETDRTLDVGSGGGPAAPAPGQPAEGGQQGTQPAGGGSTVVNVTVAPTDQGS